MIRQKVVFQIYFFLIQLRVITTFDTVLMLLLRCGVVLAVGARNQGSEEAFLLDLGEDEPVGFLLSKLCCIRLLRRLIRHRIEHDQIELARVLVAQLVFQNLTVFVVDLQLALVRRVLGADEARC